MAKIDYEFDQGDGRPNKAGMRLRLAAIFIVVAALTCAIVYFLIPKSDGTPEELPALPPEESTTLPADDENVREAESRDPVEVSPGTESELPQPADGQSPDPETTVEETSGTEETPPEASPEQTEEATLLPEKGKPWIGDPIIDRPDVPKTDIPTDVKPSLDAAFTRAETSLGEKNFAAAAESARAILGNSSVIPYSSEWRQAAALLTEANLTAFETRAEMGDSTLIHPVRPGESYSALAAKYHTTIDAIKHYNRVPEKDNILRIGNKPLIHPGPWPIMTPKNARLPDPYNRDPLYALFDVGIGRLGKTPTAKFVISSKLRNPDWYMPGGGVVKYGDPENPLGNYFLKLAPTGSPDRPLLGYGIHGTQDESDITRSLSNGCIRMRDADVSKLYIIVPARTPVEIVE